ASDLSPRCLELARQMGATAVMDPRDEEQVAHYQQHKGYFDVVSWILWRKAVRPQLTRRVEEAKAAQEQAQVRQETEEAVEVRLS
ncbi:hypothetical protein MJL33_32280, partial [Salmonella enterica subsp. enterica serovar Kentucky]|nr:hypothetical protein [Salmonella enterica subsp. enterica serovar Kentucky]